MDCCIMHIVSLESLPGGEVRCRQEVSSTAVVRRQRNLFSRIVPSDIEGPGAEPGTTTKGCTLLECRSRSGIARSCTPVHGQPGGCSWWSWACIEYKMEPGASEGHAELQPRSRLHPMCRGQIKPVLILIQEYEQVLLNSIRQTTNL